MLPDPAKTGKHSGQPNSVQRPPLARRNDSRKMQRRREEENIAPSTSLPDTSDTARLQELYRGTIETDDKPNA